MKKFIYIFSALFLVLTACQEDLIEPVINKGDGGEYATLKFTTTIPEFKIATKADTDMTNLYLMTFDAEGKFLGRINADSFGNGSGSARVNSKTRRIHFVANHNWPNYDEEALLDLDETEVMGKSLVTSERTFWGRVTVESLYESIHVDLLRNYAKIDVIKDPDGQGHDFGIVGFVLGNYPTTGTIATYGESTAENGFKEAQNLTTLPSNLDHASPGDGVAMNMDTKYMFETDNLDDPLSCVIIKIATGKDYGDRYYKVQFIKPNTTTLEHWKIERNYNYKILIHRFESAPHSNGSGSIGEALAAAPANNLYAEVVQESPIISDVAKNKLVLDKLVYLYTTGTSFSIQANYYPANGNGQSNNTGITWNIVKDADGILSGIGMSNGELTGTVKTVTSGQSEATIRISNGELSRIVTIISSVAYSFSAVSPIVCGGIDDDVNLTFTIPEGFPLYPVECQIEANNLYPVGEDKNMLLVYKDNKYYYIYEAKSPGEQTVHFKSSVDSHTETIKITNEFFIPAEVTLQRPANSFSNVSVSNAPYGTGQNVTIKFTVSNYTTPFTVNITAPTLGTGTYSYTVNRGDEHSVTLQTNVANSAGFVTLKATEAGYRSVKTSFKCVATAQTKTGNTIRYGSGTINNMDGGTGLTVVPNQSDGTTGVAIITAVNNSSIYTVSIAANADVNQKVLFRHSVTTGTGRNQTTTYYQSWISVEQLLNGEKLMLLKQD